MMRIGFVIPARGGSKGIKDKNLQMVMGRYLIEYPVRLAKAIAKPEDIVVTSDSANILSVAGAAAPGIVLHTRPPELATDEITLDPVIVDAAKQLDTDIVITLLPTCPFLREEVLRAAIPWFSGAPLIAAVCIHEAVWDNAKKEPLTGRRVIRQQNRNISMESGAFSICGREELLKSGTRYYHPPELIQIPKTDAFDIDEPEDLDFARRVMNV